MNDYLSDDFLLVSKAGKALYHEHVKSLPIIDFHCHIDPQSVADDKVFNDIAELWVCKDPYKWRAMRMNGIEEQMITGDASNRQKFNAWAQTVPYTIGNPLFHWNGLELKRYFGVDDLLVPASADAIWERCNSQLSLPQFSARGLLKQANVETICTSDDLLDSLDPHRQMFEENGALKMHPSLRADSLLAVETPSFTSFCKSLSEKTGIHVNGLDAFKSAVQLRLDVFHDLGCRLADHALDRPFFELITEDVADRLFDNLMAGGRLSDLEQLQLKTTLLVFAGQEYAARNWIMQLHIGAQRMTSGRLRSLAGPAGGYACIGSSSDVVPVSKLLNHLESDERLPRTILYTLNPSDTDMFASLTGSFAEDGVPGKVQFGPAWWWNDNRDGIVRQLRALGNLGLLGRHIGMTTDSRSLLSYSRHEYYRRIVCNLIGEWVDAGELPKDQELLKKFVQDVCYFNAKNWLQTN